jgi:hypothetical protein
MSGAMAEQRNRYKGAPPRPWVLVHLLAPDGTDHEIELLADTGSPFALILGDNLLRRLKHGPAQPPTTHTSLVGGGVVRLAIPDIGLDVLMIAYASDVIVGDARVSSPDFGGLAGLPFLRMMEYGGDADWFWIRPSRGMP